MTEHVTIRELTKTLQEHGDRIERIVKEAVTPLGDRITTTEHNVIEMKANEKNRITRDSQRAALLSIVVSSIIGLISIFWKK